jgi:nicotinamide mononucleotide transporter
MKLFYFEVIAFISGVLNIYLITRSSLWNWLFGIITVLLYSLIFFSSKLYADMGLQGVFLAFQFYGLYQWQYGSSARKPLSIQVMNQSAYLPLFISAVILFSAISFILKQYTDSTTVYADACVTALSLIAQWMMSKKYLHHWLLWIGIDILSIGLYLSKSLYLTALLYSIFMLLCVKGYHDWKKIMLNPTDKWSHSVA